MSSLYEIHFDGSKHDETYKFLIFRLQKFLFSPTELRSEQSNQSSLLCISFLSFQLTSCEDGTTTNCSRFRVETGERDVDEVHYVNKRLLRFFDLCPASPDHRAFREDEISLTNVDEKAYLVGSIFV
jgi:hypothetical protein